jgi:hypothetical protein
MVYMLGITMPRGTRLSIDEVETIFSILDSLTANRNYVPLKTIVETVRKNGINRNQITISFVCRKYAENNPDFIYKGGLIRKGTDLSQVRVMKRPKNFSEKMQKWEEMKKALKDRGVLPIKEAMRIMDYRIDTFKSDFHILRRADPEGYKVKVNWREGILTYDPDAEPDETHLRLNKIMEELRNADIDEFIEKIKNDEIMINDLAAILGVSSLEARIIKRKLLEGEDYRRTKLGKLVKEIKNMKALSAN